MPSSSSLSTAVQALGFFSRARCWCWCVLHTERCMLFALLLLSCWRCFFTTRRLQQPNRSCARARRHRQQKVRASTSWVCTQQQQVEREWRSFKIKLNWLFHKRASSSASHISPFFPSHSRLVSLTRAYSHINTFSSSATDPRVRTSDRATIRQMWNEKKRNTLWLRH